MTAARDCTGLTVTTERDEEALSRLGGYVVTMLLTSFREAESLSEDWERWSGARWAPRNAATWPTVDWAKPLRPDGTAIRLRDFGADPLPAYREYMLELYRSRWPEIREWIGKRQSVDLAIACWCPYTKTARAQMARFGSFHCHLSVVAEVLEACSVPSKLGTEHEKKMVRG